MKFVCIGCGAASESRPAICPWCLGSRTFGAEVTRETPGLAPGSFATTAELVRVARSPRRELPPGWSEIFGSWDGSPTSLLIHGPAGAGKSTLSLLGAHHLFRSCVYLAGEEGHGTTLIQRLNRLELVSTTVVVVAGRQLSGALGAAQTVDAEAIVVDSIGVVPLVASDVSGVLSQGRSLWLVAHESKDQSNFKGHSWIGHCVDLILRVHRIGENGIECEIEKSRWGALGPATVLI